MRRIAIPLLRMLRMPQRRLVSSLSFAARNDFTHCIIGGGVVGLAIARQLMQEHPDKSTVLLERHGAVGTETSSRNSEVIHAGLYYPPESLKTLLCIRGNSMLYEYCKKYRIPYRRTGKWIVAQDADQLARLDGIFNHAASLGIPINRLTPEQAAEREPRVRAAGGALESPRTGIVDSHALMRSLLGAFEEAGGDVALGTAVTKIEPLAGGRGGYKVVAAAAAGAAAATAEITADVVVNAAGLGAVAISNMVLPPGRRMEAYFCKGSYFSYSSQQPGVNTLIYPAPVKGQHGGLGTHLTLDMAGRMRFGPDVEWVEDPEDLAASEGRIADAMLAIKTYLPGIDETGLAPDYCGIRPKIKPQGEGSADFVIRQEDGFPGFVNLVGIESPGLTSSLAIAEYVNSILYK